MENPEQNGEMQGGRVSRRRLLTAATGTVMVGALATTAHADAVPAEKGARAKLRFSGKTALITGGARGQGRAHAVRLAREGADVVLCDILEQISTVDYPMATQADMDETVRLVQAEGGRCIAVKADVRDAKAASAVVERTLHEFGKIDILLANAGILGAVPLGQMTDQAFEDMIRTNLFGAFNYIKAVLPAMTERKYGRIIATSSQAGRMGMAELAHYSASKWGVIGLVKSVALEVAATGITVNAVCPTAVNTPMGSYPAARRRALPNDPAPTREKFEANAKAHPFLPQGVPWVEADEVSDTILFLASDQARHITGSVIDIQAGAAAKNIA
jgi:SDR family mycofactocin-dependent oxidoreductase